MNASIKLTKQHVFDFQNFATLMYNVNFNFITYVEFWAIGNVLQRVAKISYKANFETKKHYTLSLTPVEIESFLTLVALSENLLNQTPYYNAMFLEIAGQLHKHAMFLDDKKQQFSAKINLTIPKLITQ
jgi:hypothetical protein